MKLALLGVGNAGIRLVDQLHGAEGSENPISNGNVLAINTTPSTFTETDHIDGDRMVLVGDTHPEVYQPETLRGGDESDDGDAAETTARPEGVAGDPDLGVEVARDDLPEIRRALDSVDDTEVDAAMVVAGLGGGTGCGVGSVLLEELVSIYEIPVYVLGVLPSDDEGDQRAWNAARAIRTVVPMADAVLPVDNETWHDGGDEYAAVNNAVTTRLLSLFGAGETQGPPLPELRMDPNDIKRTLAVGGVSTIGYVQTELPVEPVGWFEKLRRLLGWGTATQPARSDATTIKKLVEEALESEFTLPCDISTTDRVLLILTGPPRELSRKGFETGRSLLETETGTVEILAGDNPDPEATAVTATLLLANVTGVERIETLQERAVAFEREHRDQPTEPEDDNETAQPTETGGETETGADSVEPIEAEIDTVHSTETAGETETGADSVESGEAETDTVHSTETVGEQPPAETPPEIDEAESDATDSDDDDHGFKFESKQTHDPDDDSKRSGTEIAGDGESKTETSKDVESLVVEAEPAADADAEIDQDADEDSVESDEDAADSGEITDQATAAESETEAGDDTTDSDERSVNETPTLDEDTDSDTAEVTEDATEEPDSDTDSDTVESDKPTAAPDEITEQDTATESDTDAVEDGAEPDGDAADGTVEASDEIVDQDTAAEPETDADSDTAEFADDAADESAESDEQAADTMSTHGEDADHDTTDEPDTDADSDTVESDEDAAEDRAEPADNTDSDTATESDEDADDDSTAESDEDADDNATESDDNATESDDNATDTGDPDKPVDEESDGSGPTIKDPFAGPSTLDDSQS